MLLQKTTSRRSLPQGKTAATIFVAAPLLTRNRNRDGRSMGSPLLDELLAFLEELGITAAINDERYCGAPIKLTFQGALRPDQNSAAEALLAHDIGVLSATAAFGKTVLAAKLITARGVNTLILVHRQQLMEQWEQRLTEFLDITPKEIGRLGGGRRKLKGKSDRPHAIGATLRPDSLFTTPRFFSKRLRR